jgi:hypothetical protein
LKRVVHTLEALGIEYFVTGSIASSIQGEVRSTHDIDLVVALPPDKVDGLVAAFSGPEYYLAREAITDALRSGSMFNLIAIDEGEKIDFWLRQDDPFDQSRFGRKVTMEAYGIRLNLRWAKLCGGSEKQFTDALRVYELQKPRLDLAYLDAWAKQLGVEELWARVQSEAQPL